MSQRMSQGLVRKTFNLFPIAKWSEYDPTQDRVKASTDVYSVAYTKLAQCLILFHQNQLFTLQDWSIVQLIIDQDEKYNPSWWKEPIEPYTQAYLSLEGKHLDAILASCMEVKNNSCIKRICARTSIKSWKRGYFVALMHYPM